MRIHTLLGLASFGAVTWVGAGAASACSPPPPIETTALPGAGATDVSPMSSIFVVARGTTIPSLVLEENGVALPGTPRIDFIGSGVLG
jgi:hypothetical protein